jgi:hypothetical protein
MRKLWIPFIRPAARRDRAAQSSSAASQSPVHGYPSIHALLARCYEERTGERLPVPEYPAVDGQWLTYCADQYAAADHRPQDSDVLQTYQVLMSELLEQFLLFVDAGYVVQLWPGSGEPYANRDAMRADVRANRHLWVYPTGDALPVDHPLAGRSPLTGYCYNDVFRAVHDLAGHAWNGYSFTVRGEEAACQAQLLLHSPAAHPALVCETRLQSAWIFVGPHRRGGSSAPLVFPPQKAFAAPADCIHHQDWHAQTLTVSTMTNKIERSV